MQTLMMMTAIAVGQTDATIFLPVCGGAQPSFVQQGGYPNSILVRPSQQQRIPQARSIPRINSIQELQDVPSPQSAEGEIEAPEIFLPLENPSHRGEKLATIYMGIQAKRLDGSTTKIALRRTQRPGGDTRKSTGWGNWQVWVPTASGRYRLSHSMPRTGRANSADTQLIGWADKKFITTGSFVKYQVKSPVVQVKPKVTVVPTPVRTLQPRISRQPTVTVQRYFAMPGGAGCATGT